MAFVPGYQNDIFISYAHADNSSAGDENGWVTEFVTRLDASVRQRLGGADVRIFFDSRHLTANSQLEELLVSARSSAIFLAIGSRSYATREWTRRELDAFCGNTQDLRRLFVAECLPLDEDERYPAPIQSHKHIEFWRVDEPRSTTPMPLSPAADRDRFHALICDLAEQIRRQLMLLKQGKAPKDSEPKPAAGNAVLLAQVTDDLEDEADQVRRYLAQYDIAVLPEAPYPQGGAEFAEAFKRDTARARLFVQLLGPRAGRTPPDLPEGYTRFQFSEAQKNGLQILQWRRPDMNLDQVPESDYKSLLTGATVIASGLAGFCGEALARAKVEKPPEKEPAPTPRRSLVFIDADRSDIDIARTVQKEFERELMPSVLPILEGAAEEVSKDLEANLFECDALVLLYGNSTPIWVHGQLRLFNKISGKRTTPPKILAIYTGPPAEKPAVSFSLPDARVIDCRTEWDMAPIKSLISELRQ